METAEQIASLIAYEPNTGILTWRYRSLASFSGNERECRRWNARHAGKNAISCLSSTGHLTGTISKKHYKAHRVAWAIYYGEWPDADIDHQNGDPADNRISNLRLASKAQNAQNKGKKSNALSSFKGVSKIGGKWKSAINSDKQRTYIGIFDDELTAAVAYDLFTPVMHGDFARPNLVNDKAAMTAFIEDYVRRNCAKVAIDGVRVWQERVAV